MIRNGLPGGGVDREPFRCSDVIGNRVALTRTCSRLDPQRHAIVEVVGLRIRMGRKDDIGIGPVRGSASLNRPSNEERVGLPHGVAHDIVEVAVSVQKEIVCLVIRRLTVLGDVVS